MAIGNGMDAIRLGRAEVMLAGGSEAAITRVGIAGFSAMRALSRRNDDPEHASRPFDAGRDGFVMGEAGAVLVLEELGHATERGARIYAELARLWRLLRRAAPDRARPDGPEPGACHAHGVRGRRHLARPDRLHQRARHLDSTRRHERDASDQTRPRRAHRPEGPDLIDQGCDRALPRRRGALEAIFCTLAIDEGVLPPTINYETPDPECDLDYVPNEARKADVGVAVSNSSGFGGHNASIVLRRFAG